MVVPCDMMSIIPEYHHTITTCADPEGAGDPDIPSPVKNHKNIGFLSITGPDPLKNHKYAKPAFTVGPIWARQRNAIGSQ